MCLEVLRLLEIDQLEEAQDIGRGRAMTLVAWSCVIVLACLGLIGWLGWERSSAWTWVFFVEAAHGCFLRAA